MLLGTGRLIEIVEARAKTLERILKDYISKKFTGYVVYRNDVQGVYITIALIEGNIVACRSIDRGMVYEGAECADNAMRYLYHSEGVIEVFEQQVSVELYDMLIFPLSRLERKTALITRLNAEIGVPKSVLAVLPSLEVLPSLPPSKEVAATPAPPPQPSELTPTVEAVEAFKPESVAIAKPAIEEETPPPAVEVKPPEAPILHKPIEELKISNECIDPVTLYMVMRSSQLLESIAALPLRDLLQKISNIIKDKSPVYLYVSGSIRDAVIRIVYDSQSGNINIEYGKEGAVVCGETALKEIKDVEIVDIKFWTV